MTDIVRTISQTQAEAMKAAEARSAYRGKPDDARIHCIQKQLGLGVTYEPVVRVLDEDGNTRMTNNKPMTVAERITEEVANGGEHARLLRWK